MTNLLREKKTRAEANLRPRVSGSEEAERLRRVADEEVLGLLIVVKHHLVGLAPDAGLLVAAERRMGRVGVIAVGPDAPGLNRTTEAIGPIAVAGPDSGAEAIQGVVGDFQRFRVVLELRHRNDRAEDFFLEDAHLI